MASMVANGNIAPCRFVKQDTTGKVVAAGATDVPFGISQEGSRNPPYTGLDDGYAAIAGENIHVYEENEGMNNECFLESGAAFNNGAFLKPSTAGVGIATTTDKDAYGAIALHAATAAGQLIRVKVRNGYLSV